MEDIKEKLFQFYEAGQMDLMWMLLKSSNIDRYQLMLDLYYKYKDSLGDLKLYVYDNKYLYYLIQYDNYDRDDDVQKYTYIIDSDFTFNEIDEIYTLEEAIMKLIEFLDERIG